MRIHCLLLSVILVGCHAPTDTKFLPPVDSFLLEVVSNKKNIGKDLKKSFGDESNYDAIANYVGEIKLNGGEELKLLSVIHLTGILEDAIRARSELIFFDESYKVVGKYAVGGRTKFPITIQDHRFVKFSVNPPCDKLTQIDFSKGLPKLLFINCTESGGDLYPLVGSSDL